MSYYSLTLKSSISAAGKLCYLAGRLLASLALSENDLAQWLACYPPRVDSHQPRAYCSVSGCQRIDCPCDAVSMRVCGNRRRANHAGRSVDNLPRRFRPRMFIIESISWTTSIVMKKLNKCHACVML